MALFDARVELLSEGEHRQMRAMLAQLTSPLLLAWIRRQVLPKAVGALLPDDSQEPDRLRSANFDTLHVPTDGEQT